MKTDFSFTRVAGALAIAIGILYLLVGVNYLFMPEAQKEYLNPEFWPSFSAYPASGMIEYIAFAAIGILALGVVPVISGLAGGKVSGFFQWVVSLGMLGFAVHVVEVIRFLALTKRIADAYVAGDAATRSAVAAIGLQHLDPLHLFKFGLVGLWLLVVSILGISKKTLPAVLCVIGIVGGVGFWILLVGNVLQLVPLVTAMAITAIVLGPIWYIWVGVRLLRGGAASAP
jgi:hypothetical protein